MRTPALAIVTTTVASARQAQRLADGVIGARLAACVQVTRIRSTYRWRGNVTRAPEWLLIMKTRADRTRPLLRFVRAHHPYELPELLVLPAKAGHAAYGKWVASESAE